MSIPNYLHALANYKGPAIVIAGGMTIPVNIMDIQHESSAYNGDESTFKCMVVNADQIRAAKSAINSVYGANPKSMEDVDYVARCLAKSTTGKGVCESKRTVDPMAIDRVIFNAPATIVFWTDGTKTVVKCQEGDAYSKETGLALCIAKKALGNKGNFNNIFRKWIPEEDEAQEAESPEPTSVLSCIPPAILRSRPCSTTVPAAEEKSRR